jgi:FkbM family methyltransferase
MNTVKLPNRNEPIFCINAAEALLLYEEIYVDQCYLKHGVTIHDQDCVFDVGANIGLFSMFANQQASDLELYVFEPVPPIFEVLIANLELDHIGAKRFSCGLSNAVGGAGFAFCDRNSGMSGKYWNVQDEKKVAETILINRYPDLKDYVDELVEAGFGPDPLLFDCPLRTLSDVIGERNIRKIDLLKIDVEKSEMDVLNGIDEMHWSFIRQIVMEVHDIDGRACAVERLLASHDFKTNVVEHSFFRGTGLYEFYAVRQGTAEKNTI